MLRARTAETRMKSLPLDEAITRYIEVLEIQGKRSSHTLRAYVSDLRDWARAMGEGGFARLEDLDQGLKPLHLRGYLARFSETHERSSLCRRLSSIRGFLKYCRSEGWLERDIGPLIPSPKTKRTPGKDASSTQCPAVAMTSVATRNPEQNAPVG